MLALVQDSALLLLLPIEFALFLSACEPLAAVLVLGRTAAIVVRPCFLAACGGLLTTKGFGERVGKSRPVISGPSTGFVHCSEV